MLWLITGGIGSGKSDFAEQLALTVGHEGIRLLCPPFPIRYSAANNETGSLQAGFRWTFVDADETLAYKLNAINMESNIFRADRRVLVVDSLSGWLRGLYHRVEDNHPDAEAAISDAWQDILTAIRSFEGKMIVITEDVAAGLSLSSRERSYAYRLAEANRLLLESCTTIYRMTAGMATEVKGYRLKRGNMTDENIYKNR